LPISVDSGDDLAGKVVLVLEPVDYYFGYFSAGPFPAGTTELDSIFYFCNTPYRWLPLVKERITTAIKKG
jgi:hypothetical protein